MIIPPRSNLKKLEPCVHGGLSSITTSTNDHILDLSVSINPPRYLADLQKIVREVPLDIYPERFSTEARLHLAKNLSVKKENIIVGNGSAELIQAICLAYLETGDNVLSFSPTFREYERCSRLMKANYKPVPLSDANQFRLDVKIFVKAILSVKPKIVFLCNPNNPTGYYFGEEDFKQIVSASKHSLVVLDEAYIYFVDQKWNSVPYVRNGNVVILRSMTKDYSLTALRIGYVVAHEQICQELYKVLPPWNVNSYAQKMIVEVLTTLSKTNYFIKMRHRISLAKAYLIAELKKLNLHYIPSTTNFLLIKLPSLNNTQDLFLKYKIMVRDCKSYGINLYIRIAIRTRREMAIFAQALRSILHKDKLCQ